MSCLVEWAWLWSCMCSNTPWWTLPPPPVLCMVCHVHMFHLWVKCMCSSLGFILNQSLVVVGMNRCSGNCLVLGETCCHRSSSCASRAVFTYSLHEVAHSGLISIVADFLSIDFLSTQLFKSIKPLLRKGSNTYVNVMTAMRRCPLWHNCSSATHAIT